MVGAAALRSSEDNVKTSRCSGTLILADEGSSSDVDVSMNPGGP